MMQEKISWGELTPFLKKWQFAWRNGDGSHGDYGLLLAGLLFVIGFSWAFLTKDILTCAAFFAVRSFCSPCLLPHLKRDWCHFKILHFDVYVHHSRAFSIHYKLMHQKLSPLYGFKVINTFDVNSSLCHNFTQCVCTGQWNVGQSLHYYEFLFTEI